MANHLSTQTLQANYDDAIEAWNDEINRRKAVEAELATAQEQLASRKAILKMIEFPCHSCHTKARADLLYLCYGCKRYFCESCSPTHFDGIEEQEQAKAREVKLRGERDFFKKMMGRTKVGKLVKALEFYANEANYEHSRIFRGGLVSPVISGGGAYITKVEVDLGAKAKAALEVKV